MLTEKKDGEMLSEPEHKEEPKEELVHTLLVELKETLASLDRAVTNKETRTVSKLAKRVRKYRNIIKAHHIIAIF